MSSKDFTRESRLSSPNLIEMFLNTSRNAIKIELNNFFNKKTPSIYRNQLIDKSTFTKARAKLKESAFIELLSKTVNNFYQQVPVSKHSTWYGFRTLAVDGSDLNLPNNIELAEHFGVQNNNTDIRVPMAKLSLLYDTALDLPIEGILDSKNTSERELAQQHLKRTQEKDLLLYDCGYYAYWFVLLHFIKNREFCLRVKSTANNQVKEFVASRQKQAVITINPSIDMQQKAIDKGLKIQEVKVRLIRIKTSKGYYILMTSLTDKISYPAKDFYELYHRHWRIEEGYKKQKSFLNLENFSGKTVHAIKQDVHASILIQALIAIETFASQPFIKSGIETRKFHYKINFSIASQLFKQRIVKVLSQQYGKVDIYLYLKALAENLTIIKLDRSFSRKKVRCRRQKFRVGYNA